MNITIRPYQPQDSERILEIINYNIVNSTSLYDYKERTLEQQKQLINKKIAQGFPVIVAEVNSIVVGFGQYGAFRTREAYKYTVEHSVYVQRDFLGKGIGKSLLSELISIAKLKKIHTMVAVIDSENTVSIQFHEKFGFVIVGIIKESGYKFDRWLDSVFMQIIL